jgi:hypothetical protein
LSEEPLKTMHIIRSTLVREQPKPPQKKEPIITVEKEIAPKQVWQLKNPEIPKQK